MTTTFERLHKLLQDNNMLIEHNAILVNGMNCALRILELKDDDERGVTLARKMSAATEVLHVARERARGLPEACVSEETKKVLDVVLADVEVRLLYDKLGLKTWGSA